MLTPRPRPPPQLPVEHCVPLEGLLAGGGAARSLRLLGQPLRGRQQVAATAALQQRRVPLEGGRRTETTRRCPAAAVKVSAAAQVGPQKVVAQNRYSNENLKHHLEAIYPLLTDPLASGFNIGIVKRIRYYTTRYALFFLHLAPPDFLCSAFFVSYLRID